MLSFFRTIRRNLLDSNQVYKYLKYAAGEIILVVIGILIALQINNWRELRKSELSKIQMYENLLISLRQDSTVVKQIITLHNNCLETQSRLLSSSKEEIKTDLTDSIAVELASDIIRGSVSLFPNKGVYNSIVSNGEIDLIDDNELKISLIKLYDHHYGKYANIDAVVDHVFQFQIFPLIDGKMMTYYKDSIDGENKRVRRINSELFLLHYDEMTSEIKTVYRILNTSHRVLKEIQEAINDLISDISKELERLE